MTGAHLVWDFLGTFGSVLWAIVTAVVVPLGAAGLAAYFVVQQIQRADKYRVQDRRGAGVRAASTVFMTIAEWCARNDGETRERLTLNNVLIRARRRLVSRDIPAATAMRMLACGAVRIPHNGAGGERSTYKGGLYLYVELGEGGVWFCCRGDFGAVSGVAACAVGRTVTIAMGSGVALPVGMAWWASSRETAMRIVRLVGA